MDGKIWLSTGASRKETSWKNIELKWSQLVEKLKKTKVTEETYKEYLKLKRDEQDEIKDVGGFVGGIITGGRRKHNAIASRYLITLDLDFANADFFEDFKLVYGNAAFIYSTHKHSPDKPRYRLILPLDREVHSDEYEAIARKIAGILGIDLFDPTTFQPERLMYWPSTSKDAEYYWEEQKGPWLSADKVLKSYKDWRDVSQWPVSSETEKKILRGVEKQEDPFQKPGIIGVFCREYSIQDAIDKFLGDVYKETEIDGRYTYIHGSTSAGAVVYEDKFLFSHHSTDPVGNRLCNAFDLVRIHKFGNADEGKEETPTNKLPSYKKMLEWAIKDPTVKRVLVSNKIAEAKSDFGGETVPDEEINLDWTEQLEVNTKGECTNTINNMIIILQNDEKFKGKIMFNDFEKRPMVQGDLPWRKTDKYNNWLVDSDDSEFRNYFEMIYKLTHANKLQDALDIVSHRNLYHPIKTYLKGIVWDQTERLETLLIDYLGADDNVFVREATRKTFVAAVARIFEPGIKFDTVLTLVGRQGLGKSRLVALMGKQWYSDTFGSLHNKDAMEQIQGVWLMEIGELAGFKKAEIETIKLFISKQEDRFRVAYGRRVNTFARQCIFIGSTNIEAFLQDPTGGRRFWPIKCGVWKSKKNIFKDLKGDIVDQLWAEACYWYSMGEDLYLTSEVESVARKIQEHHTEEDERKGAILDYLDTLVPENWNELDMYARRSFLQGDEISGNGVVLRDRISIPEIWCEKMGNQIKDMSFYNTKYIRNIMDNLPGWQKHVIKTTHYGSQRGYIRVSNLVTKGK